MVRIVIVGVVGCMGCNLVKVIYQNLFFELGVGFECLEFLLVGVDIGELCGIGK